MSGESNADVYASFGVQNAVVGGSTIEEHEQNMLALDVETRDGDDRISLSDNDDPYGQDRDPFAEEGEEDEGRMQVRINTDGNSEDTLEEPEVEITNEGQELSEGETEGDSEIEPVGDIPDDLTTSADLIGEHEAGFNEMVEQATERGLTPEMVAQIRSEYEADGISDSSYEALAAAGYSRGFVDSYIKGQEALVEQYVNQVMSYAGGPEKFQAVQKHLEVSNKEASESLLKALEQRDLSTVKAILNLASSSYNRKFGTKATRSITKQATQAKPQAQKRSEGFASRDEMVKAMSDSRYRTDAKFRQEVEQRVYASNF